jgi:superfamily II DNA or RNA helicase
VVGLGKSIVASAIAKNMDDVDKTVIIAPPHLKDQWDEYSFEFGLVGSRVVSSGKIEELHRELAQHHSPILYIIDEAHRYRNEITDTYQYLHQLTRSHAQNRVILLTATPYNNRPQDLFALVKLFQMPSHSTINTVDNLSVRFRELIARYNDLEKQGKKDLTAKIKQELYELSEKLRVLIEPVVIRRSRIDLKEIKEYADDLRTQNIQFAEVEGPDLVNYELGDIQDLYIKTLEKLSNDFTSARYNPTSYLINPGEFMSKYGELFFATDLRLIQSNLAKLIKRLLVMRFESSKAAFYTSLVSFISYYNKFVKWWEIGYVPILKAGHIEDPDEDEIEQTLSEINDNEENLDIKAIRKKAIPIPREMFKNELIDAIHSDIHLLTELKREWFPTDEIGYDPKFAEVKIQIDNMLLENSQRKIVIFSYFFTTAEYVYKQLNSSGYKVMLYSGASNKTERNVVRQNFDASYKQSDQRDDYDIIVATDALSEGFNLNRAGIVINYDIPYNPTRVVQRIGRINRINKMLFSKICIYNFFPTVIGEENISIKSISTLKMLLINNIVGSDTRTLTPDEDLKSYFKQQFVEADTSSAERSWDIEYRNIFNNLRHNHKLMEEVYKIPERVRIIRHISSLCKGGQGGFKEAVISFVKRGNHSLFAIAEKGCQEASIKSAHEVLHLFQAEPDEKGFRWDFITEKTFAILKEKIKEAYPKIKLDQRKSKAIDNLMILREYIPTEKDYLDDLLDIIKDYDDLCDSELKYIANLTIKSENAKKIICELKEEISEHYIIAIKNKAEQIKTQTEIILFTEDLRHE